MKKHGPWQIKSSEVKYKNPWMEVREDAVLKPDGKDGIYGVAKLLPGVSVLALDDDRNVYLTLEFKYAVAAESLEVVSGGVDTEESPLHAAQRELKEETGIEADEWIDLGVVNPLTSVVHAPAWIYLARKLRFSPDALESTETLSVQKVKFDDAVQMVMNSKISHGPSCVTILKASIFLDSQGV